MGSLGERFRGRSPDGAEEIGAADNTPSRLGHMQGTCGRPDQLPNTPINSGGGVLLTDAIGIRKEGRRSLRSRKRLQGSTQGT